MSSACLQGLGEEADLDSTLWYLTAAMMNLS
jgi:hypothetical protein